MINRLSNIDMPTICHIIKSTTDPISVKKYQFLRIINVILRQITTKYEPAESLSLSLSLSVPCGRRAARRTRYLNKVLFVH